MPLHKTFTVPGMIEAKSTCYPLTFQPVYQDYIWGGQKLHTAFNRDLDGPVIAESWEITDREDGMSVVDQGPATGKSLQDLVELMGSDLLGTQVVSERFPLLIKILDANQVLSVQVHPNDETAIKFGGEAKTEMWYVLDAEPDAKVYCGLDPETDEASFIQAIKDQTLDQILTTIPVKKGDAIFVPGGRVHAIDAGCLLLEVQQNSNTTYRIYDWGRLGADGNPRDLHIEQSLQVIEWDDVESAVLSPGRLNAHLEEIISCPYFTMQRFNLSGSKTYENDGSSFHSLFAVNGDITVNDVPVPKGRSVLLPAALSEYTIRSAISGTEVIRVFVPH